MSGFLDELGCEAVLDNEVRLEPDASRRLSCLDLLAVPALDAIEVNGEDPPKTAAAKRARAAAA